jgi:hypothetical protein
MPHSLENCQMLAKYEHPNVRFKTADSGVMLFGSVTSEWVFEEVQYAARYSPSGHLIGYRQINLTFVLSEGIIRLKSLIL